MCANQGTRRRYRPAHKIQLPKGRVIVADNSRLQKDLLDSIHSVVKTKNIMAGIGTLHVFEQIRYMESERSRGFEMTRISYAERKKEGVARLLKDKEMQRREGMIRDSPATTT